MAKRSRRAAAGRRSMTAPASRRAKRGKPAVTDATGRIQSDTDFIVVGVGASAGGLEAFSDMLGNLPPNPGVAIVFVQHLAPQHESALVQLLSVHTALPVVQASTGMRVERDHVYVIPPNSQMLLDGLELRVGPRPHDRTQYTPVDPLLSSLASSRGARAVAVILSGTGSDGAAGIRDVKEMGGITIAQSPESAKHNGMPHAAIATGMVDLVLPPSEIGAKLAQIARHADLAAPEGPDGLQLSEDQLHQIFDVLRPVSGVDFRHYKLPTVKRRLLRRMALHRLSEVDGYLRLLRSDRTEARNLYRDLLIHVTRFFREPESFEAISRDVLPAIVKERSRDEPIRVWVSGCATGEEAYSLAITLVEFLARQQADLRVQIFATDVSEAAVEHARAGMYPKAIEADVSPDRLRRFFSRHEDGYRVTKMIRDLCIFARQDLTKDPPFSRLDLILCRNVLIYMDLVLQKKLLSVFHYALNPSGFLVLGQAETVGAQATFFSLVDKKHRIHRRRATANPPAMTFPVDYSAVDVPVKKPHADVPNADRLLQSEVNRVINDRFAPPGVVVDSDMQIVQFRGQTSTFLEPAPGQATLNLLKMVKEGLLYGLRSAINAARKSRAPIHRSGLQVRIDKSWRRVDLDVIPLSWPGRSHYLVLFHAQPRRPAAEAPRATRGRGGTEPATKSQMHSLERELAASREYLQSVIQELEAANEELQSANEEILSSNEELQSTNEELDTAKEELQSTNEELNTVNEELHGRNEELSRVNSDLLNLLGSVQIAIVIVGSDMRIRRFTPMAEKVLNLIPADVDRAIGHINPNIEGANLEQLIAECIENISLIEREVRDRQGRWYALRVRPYRSTDNKIDGAVLALFDVDAPKRYEASVRSATDLAVAILQASAVPMAVIDAGGKIRTVNARFVELLDLSSGDGVEGQLLGDLVQTGAGFDRLDDAARASDKAVGTEIAVEVRPPRLKRSIGLTARVLAAYDGTPGSLVLLTARSEPSARASS